MDSIYRDGRLARAAQRRETGAFEELYELHFDAVYGYLRSTLRSDAEAEDAAQQVFMKVYEALPRYRPGTTPLRAWLLRIARNHAIDRLRRNLPAPSDPHGSAGPEAAACAPPDSDERLRALIEELPLLQRQVLVLRYMLDFAPAEVADVLGRSPGAVRQAQHRALRTLQRLLERDSADGLLTAAG